MILKYQLRNIFANCLFRYSAYLTSNAGNWEVTFLYSHMGIYISSQSKRPKDKTSFELLRSKLRLQVADSLELGRFQVK